MCDFCTREKRIMIDTAGKEQATLYTAQDAQGMLELESNKETQYIISVKYCPFCGEKLSFD